MLQAFASLLVLSLTQSAREDTAPRAFDHSEGAALRRAAVESAVTPVPSVAGYEPGILGRMRELNVPGVSVAVIHEGRIDWAAGYGVRDAASRAPVTTETLFQAGSISKPVAALAAIRLAQEGKLDLDASINTVLSSWQLPDDGFEGVVSARRLMSHTGGLGVHGFGGYATFDPVPSTVEVLDGSGVANTAAVRRIDPLDRGVRYSGGGSTILQLAMCDLSGKDFAPLVDELVMQRLGMQRSTYAQPLPVEHYPDHSAGHGHDGRVIAGRFRIHPEQFAAGLWTTASDVARFALELQEPGQVLTPEWAQRMLTPVHQAAAMGLFLEEHGGEMWFGHGGSNMGFKNNFRASLQGGRGVCVLTNGDLGSRLAQEIMRAVTRVYGWPGQLEKPMAAGAWQAGDAAKYTGRFGFGPDDVVRVSSEDEALYFQRLPERRGRLAPLGKDTFLLMGTTLRVKFRTGEGGASAVTLMANRPGANAVAERLDEYERWPVDDLLEGALEDALDFYREVHAADPSDPMVARDRLGDLASNLWDDQHLDAGLAMATLITELFREDAGAWNQLGEYHASRGDRSAASKAFRTCLEVLGTDPRRPRGWLDMYATSMLRGLERGE